MKIQSFTIMLVLSSLLIGCTTLPDIPNISKDTLRKLPYNHVKIIRVITDDHRETCYQRLESRLKEGETLLSDSEFVVNPFTISQAKVSTSTKVTIFIRNFSCAGENLWKATGTIKAYVIARNNVFTAWVSGPPFIIRDRKKYILVLPQHQALCSDLDHICQSLATWDNLEQSFTVVKGPQTLIRYNLPE